MNLPDPFDKYSRLGEEDLEVWGKSLEKLKEELAQSASDYINEMCKRAARTAYLSRIYIFG